MAGFPLTKDTINTRAGVVVTNLRDALAAVDLFAAGLARMQDGDLTALGFSSQDVTDLRTVFGDLANLSQTVHGQRAQTPASDFFFNIYKLTALQ